MTKYSESDINKLLTKYKFSIIVSPSDAVQAHIVLPDYTEIFFNTSNQANGRFGYVCDEYASCKHTSSIEHLCEVLAELIIRYTDD